MGLIWTLKLDFHKNLTKFVDKDEPFGATPVITTMEHVDMSMDTQIDLPDIGGRARLESMGQKVFAQCEFEGD